jgi:prepilin-type N-terminal cleavage/methylation domain-containing protein
MSHRFQAGRRGFTLIEVLVTMIALVIIVVAAGQLLFDTQSIAQRQQYQVDVRQTARAAADFANYLLRGATDMNTFASSGGFANSGAIMTWIWFGVADGTLHTCPGTGCSQTTYDNLTTTQASYGDVGTDIITFAVADNVQFVQPVGQVIYLKGVDGAGTFQWSPPFYCPSPGSSNALSYFQQVTGESSAGASELMIVANQTGNWGFYQITSYGNNSACCTTNCVNSQGASVPCIKVTSPIGLSKTYNPPGLVNPVGPDSSVNLIAGVRFKSLRVCQTWLEEKDGVFDPAADGGAGVNACTGSAWNTSPWTPLLPNVEDLQFAYIYNEGAICNNLSGSPVCNSMPGTTGSGTTLPTTGAVPSQAGPGGTLDSYDASRVIAVRVTVTARSATPFPHGAEATRFHKLPAENNAHDGTITANDLNGDAYFRFQVRSVAMIRNRTNT